MPSKQRNRFWNALHRDAYRNGMSFKTSRVTGCKERHLANNHFRLLNAALKLWEIENRLGIREKKKRRNAQCSHS